ncbi:MAG: XTP/dITP diphosphatase [Candidatus Zhuqueibacterota bacterium]
MKIVLATRNRDKLREIQEIFKSLPLEIITMDYYPNIPEVIEDGATLEQNAIKKASEVHNATGLLAVADDTGLEVDYLDGRPGVYSSRFAGENASYDDNVNKLLATMQGVPDEKRLARFRCVISIIGNGIHELVEGSCPGVILTGKRGSGGFGYDPVFFVPRYNQTFAEMSLALKNEISHRGQALRLAKAVLERILREKN